MAQFATVVAVHGNGAVFAVDVQGNSRPLKVGDVLQKGETVRTTGDAGVELLMEDGRSLAVAPMQNVLLDEQVVESDQRPTAQESAVVAPGTIDTVIQTLERGGDLSQELEAAAAGLVAPGSAAADGGNSFVQLLRITEGVEPLAYRYGFDAPGLPPDVQALPSEEDSQPVVGWVTLDGRPAVVEEGGLQGGNLGGNTSTSGTLAINTGNDLIGNVVVDTLKIDGVDVTAGGVVHGTFGDLVVSVDPAGNYSWVYTLNPVDGNAPHTNPGAVGGADQFPEDTFVVEVTDDDGDTATDNLVIEISDDGPTAFANSNSVNEGGVVAGNVLTDGVHDVFGADGAAAGGGVVGVRAGSDTSTPASGGLGGGIAGAFGTLTLNADGSYSYDGAPNAVPPAGATDVFVYTIRDGDGDLSTTTLTINLSDSGLVAPADNDVLVSESALDTAITGADLAAGTVTGSLPGSPAETDASNQLNATGGVGALTYTLEGSATGTYGTIQIHSDGSYVYTLTRPFDTSPDANNGAHTEDNRDAFTYRVTDANGNTTTGNITVDIVDDVPVVSNEPAQSVAEGATVTGLFDFIGGADGASVTALNGVALTFGADGFSQAIDVGSGMLKVRADGSYSYTAANNTSGTSDTASFTVTDGDGDQVTGTAIFNIADINSPTGGSTSAAVDDDGLAGGNPTSSSGDLDANAGENPLNPSEGVFNGTLNFSFGLDGPGQVSFASLNGTSGTVGTETVNYTWNAGNGTLTATGPRGELFTVQITDPTTGAYTVTLRDNVLHAAGDNENDATAALTYTVTDSDSSTATGTLTVTFDDDTPQAVNDAGGTVTEDAASTVSGNVLSNDAQGADTTATLAAEFVGWGADTAAINALNSFGTLTQNADGSWSYVLNNSLAATQALTAASTTNYVLNYTMRDADGDTSPAQLTITIQGANDTQGVTVQAAGGAGTTVYETALVDGRVELSDPAPNSDPREAVNGNFSVSATDGIASVTVGGTVFTLAQLQTPAYLAAHPIGTGEGTLVLTSYSSGDGNLTATIGYTYTLTDNILNATAATTFFDDTGTLITVTGTGGVTSAPADLQIRIMDDTPQAVNDAGGTVTEDGASTVSGNVLGNDAQGADTPAEFVGWGADTAAINALNSFGTLTQNADGSWSYVLNNSLAATQALTAASTTNYVLNYTMRDADGDTSPAQLTITIQGTNDTQGVTVQAAGGAGTTVYETALVDGRVELSDPAPNSDLREAVSGSFSVSATDGIASVTVGGTVFTLAQLQTPAYLAAHPIGTGEGTLVLTSYSSGDGNLTATIGYTYTLTDNILNATPATTFFDDTGTLITVTGTSGATSAPADLQIRIMDDTPELGVSNLAIPNVGSIYTADYAFQIGADTQPFASSFSSSALIWTNERLGYDLVFDAGASNATVKVYDAVYNGGANTFFTISINSDGTYDFDLVTPDPVTTVDVPSVLAGVAGGSGLSSYTIGSAAFGGQFELVLTGYQGGVPDTITISSSDLGVSDNVMHGNKDDQLRFDVNPVGGADVTLATLSIHVATVAGFQPTDEVIMTVKYVEDAGVTNLGNQVIGVDQTILFTFDGSKTVDYVQIEPFGTQSFKIDGVALSYSVPTFPDDYLLNFQLTGTDADQDSASATFAVAVSTTDTGAYHVQGTAGSDVIYGTAGSDALSGNGGSDTFVWSAGSTGNDKVTDFTLGSGGDALDLRDLLTGEHANAASLDAYLDFSANGSGQTVLSVHPSGSGGVTQTITLDNVPYAALQTWAGGTSDAAIISKLLTDGNLKTDV